MPVKHGVSATMTTNFLPRRRCQKKLDYAAMAKGLDSSIGSPDKSINNPKSNVSLKKVSCSVKKSNQSGIKKYFNVSEKTNSTDPRKNVSFEKAQLNDSEKEPKSLRKKERINYALMLRGSSLGFGETGPNGSKDQNEVKNTSTTVNTSTKNKTLTKACYQEVDADDEEISPSQVFEFKFDPLQESKINKQAKKQAKVLKQVIRKKVSRPRKKIPVVNLSRLRFNDVVEPPSTNPTQNENNKTGVREPIVQVQRLTFNKNLIKKPQSTPNQKEEEGIKVNENKSHTEKGKQNQLQGNECHSYDNDYHLDDDECHLENNECHLSSVNPIIPEISQICEDFDELINPTTNNSTMNQSNPWRARLPPLITQRRPLINNSSNTSIPISTNSVSECSLYIDNSKHKQTSIDSFLSKNVERQRKTVHFELDRTSLGSTNSSKNAETDSSISDISQEVIENPVKTIRSSMKKVNFDNAVTSSPHGNVKRVNVLGEKNIYRTKNNVDNIMDKQISIALKDKENMVTNNNVVMTMQHSKDDSFFGFDLSNSENVDTRKSKIPVRISLTDLNKVIKHQKTPATSVTVISEAPEESIASVNETRETDAEATGLAQTIFDDPEIEFLEEPRFTNVVMRSYTPYKRKRKKVIIDHSEGEEENETSTPKKKRKKRVKKQDVDFEIWAKQFNSMCEDVEKEDLIVE